MALAWCVAGVASALLLAPALLEPDGVPSPAASAGAVAPWAGTVDASAGNPTLSDVTFQIQPWLLHLRRELRAGRAPFWNPYQFSGAPFWANGQSAPLFPLHLLFAALPLQLGFVLLPWLRAVIAGVGAWALARELGVAPRPALVAAVVFPLSGMFSSFLLFPMANALCLVPWVLREVERLSRARRDWWRLGGVVGLQALGGHPETVVHTALLAALYLAVRGGAGLATWGRLTAAFGAGALAAGAHLVPLCFNLAASTRWQEWSAGERLPLSAALDAALRLVLPDLYGNPAAGTWWGPFNYTATAVFAGALALPLAWMGLRDRFDDRRWKAMAAVAGAAALAAYHVFPVRELLLVIPVVNRMLHHRLLFAVDLGIALSAAAGIEGVASGRRRGVTGGSLVVAVALAAAWWRHRDDWDAAGLLAHQARWTAWIVAALLLLVAGALLASRRGARAGALVAALAGAALTGELLWAHARTNPGLPLGSLLPRTPAIEFLARSGGRVAALDAALRPNAAMVHGLRDVRGDDTLKLDSYERVYRSFAGASPYFFEPITDWRAPALDRLAARWVLAPPGAGAPVETWRVAFDGADGRVFERASALPLVRWLGGGNDGLTIAASEPGRWTIRYTTPSPRVLMIAETWDPGWRGAVDGRPRALERREETLIGAHVEAGSGTLELRYRPRGLMAGLGAAGLGVVLLLFAALRQDSAALRQDDAALRQDNAAPRRAARRRR
jgi:hypothetical protein